MGYGSVPQKFLDVLGVEVAVETSRLKMMFVAAGMAVTLLTLAGVVVGSMTEDADAARRPQLNTLWAVVDSDGTLARGKGVTESDNVSTGDYTTAFKQDVSSCASSATLLNNSGFVFLDTIRATDPLTRREVGVSTLDRNGFVPDTSFHVIVTC